MRDGIPDAEDIVSRARICSKDRSGLAAIEFAMIFPMMVAMCYGVIEFSSAICRGSQGHPGGANAFRPDVSERSVADADLKNFGEAAKAVMTPYPAAPLESSVTQVYVDKVTGVARVQWSKGLTISATGLVSIAATAPHNKGDVVALPSGLTKDDGQGELRDLERGQVHVYASDRLYDVEGWHDLQRRFVHASAPDALCYLSHRQQCCLSPAGVTAGVSDKLRHLHRSPRRPLEEGAPYSGAQAVVPETRVGSAGGAEMVAGCSTRRWSATSGRPCPRCG
jgi:hypothetical protein